MKQRVLSLFVISVAFFGQTVFAQEVSFDAIARQKEQNVHIPAITKVMVMPSSTGVRIEWDTDVLTQSSIEYGETPAYGNRASSMSDTVKVGISHRVELTGLSEFRTYHFRIRASEEESANELFSRALTFTTLPRGEISSPMLYPTPLDFSAPRITSFSHDDKDGLAEIVVTADEASLTRFEAGMYIKGAPFIFEERDTSARREKQTRFVLSGTAPGMLTLYRLTTQDRLGNRAILYGNFQTEHAAPPKALPANSVLITNPSNLAGIPKEDLWKDEKTGRLYRIFRVMPSGATLLTHPSQLAGLTAFHVWKDEKTGRLYKHAGIPNPESKEKPARIPKQWIRITHPLQLKVLFSHEVWRNPQTGVMYRKVGTGEVAEKKASSTQEKEDTYLPFYQ